jgi:hypothetical protein
MEEVSKRVTRSMTRKGEKRKAREGEEGEEGDKQENQRGEERKSKRFKPRPDAPPARDNGAHVLAGFDWRSKSSLEAGLSQHANPLSSSEIQQSGQYKGEERDEMHREINTAMTEYSVLIRSLEQRDTQAFNQGIERMEQLSKNSNYIDLATRTIKKAEGRDKQLSFIRELKRIAEANMMQINTLLIRIYLF